MQARRLGALALIVSAFLLASPARADFYWDQTRRTDGFLLLWPDAGLNYPSPSANTKIAFLDASGAPYNIIETFGSGIPRISTGSSSGAIWDIGATALNVVSLAFGGTSQWTFGNGFNESIGALVSPSVSSPSANGPYFYVTSGLGPPTGTPPTFSNGGPTFEVPIYFDVSVSPPVLYFYDYSVPQWQKWATGGGSVTSVTGTAGQILCTPSSPNPVCSLVSTGIGAGSCTNCSVTFDALGRETTYSSGTVPVTSVTATPPIFSSGGTTPVISEQGAIVSGSTSTAAQSIGAISTAPLGCVTSAGVCTVDGLTLSGGLHFNTGTGAETLDSFTCGANTFVSSSSTSGLACTQPAFSNLSGSATCGQLPALTGDTHSSAGICATVTDHVTDGGSVSHATSGTWASNAPVATDGSGNIVAKTPGTCFSCPGGTCDVVSGACGGTSTFGSSSTQVQQFTIDGYGKVQSAVTEAKGKSLVSATDPTMDYLDTKFESTSGNIAVTHISGPPEFVNVNVITAGLFDGPQTASVSANYFSYAPVTTGYGTFAIPYSTARSLSDIQNTAMEAPVGFAATKQRVIAKVTANSLSSSGGGSTITSCQSTQNGSGTSVFAGGVGGIPNASTGLFDSGVQTVGSSAATDTWGISCGGTSPLSGTITMTITVMVWR